MKEKVYIETSVVSFLTARPSQNLISAAWQSITIDWWENRRGHFNLFVSEMDIICRKFVHLKSCSEEIEMENEILEEVWKIKDEISKRYDFNIDKMVKDLKKAEEGHKERIVDLSKKAKKAA